MTNRTEDLDDAILNYIKTNDLMQYRCLIYTAYLWSAIKLKINNSMLQLKNQSLQQNIMLYRHKHNLLSEQALAQWLIESDLSIHEFYETIKMATQFDYFVKNNNVDAIGAFERGPQIWWLLDALYLSGLYPLAKDLLQNKKELVRTAKALNKKFKGNLELVYSLDFHGGIDEFKYFLSQLNVDSAVYEGKGKA